MPGLQWDDLDPVRTPALWRLAGTGATASLSTRAVPPEGLPVTCPIAGWLTLSAGQRAAAPGSACAAPPAPAVAADGSATIPGWAELVSLQRSSPFQATVGLLGRTVTAAGGTVAAIGPGAALAAADQSGKVGKYAASVAELPDLTPYTLVVAEAGQIDQAWTASGQESTGTATGTAGAPTAGSTGQDGAGPIATTGAPADARTGPAGSGVRDLSPEARRAAVAAADRTVGEILAHVPAGSTVLVAGLSDSGSAAHLHIAVATGPSGAAATTAATTTATTPATSARPETGDDAAEAYRKGWLTATSTRQEALVTLTDLTATVTHVLGLGTPDGVVGRAWQNGGEGPASARETAARLADADLASQVLRQVREPFFIVLVTAQVLFYVLASIVIRRARRMLGVTRVVATISGAVPVSVFLAQLVPWWGFAHPMPALLATILGMAVVVAAAGFAGPWRSHVLGPLTAVAGVSSAALLLDVVTGSRLQVNAVAGYEPVTGGRFYGFGNMAFAVYSTGTILLLAGVAHALRRRPRLAALVCLAYGLVAVVADGWPAWGADFGGVPSFVVGVAVFLLMVTGRRVSVVRLGLVGLAGVALVALIAVADWLRPPDRRTHLGGFVQQVVSGEGGSVIGRKLGAMLHTLGNLPLTLLSLVALAFLFLVLYRPSRWGASALSLVYERAPELRAGLFGALAAALVGFLINDSGIAIPAMALTVAVPLTLAASVRALRDEPATPTMPARPSAPAGTPAPPAP
ncbi:hypothetical protein GCM10009530_56510 [Microbispora corallina]|uniref:Uncharacterized protein n=1 Tax=Microbispora corallina TaxID=83302 RepID=A0ABQ4G8Y3_9ACTN|nr:hypothetical protein Mco01_65270 [Microbispora corallina]